MERVSNSARKRKPKSAAQRRERGDAHKKNYEPACPKGARRDAHIRWVNNDRRLTPMTKLIAVTLVTIYSNDGIYKSREKLVVWPSVRALAKDCDCSIGKVYDALKDLVETGHISPWTEPVPRRELKGRPSNAFAFNDTPVEYLELWRDFVQSRSEQSGGDFVQIQRGLCSDSGGTLFTQNPSCAQKHWIRRSHLENITWRIETL